MEEGLHKRAVTKAPRKWRGIVQWRQFLKIKQYYDLCVHRHKTYCPQGHEYGYSEPLVVVWEYFWPHLITDE